MRERIVLTKGQYVFKEGDLGDAAYIVEEGAIGVYQTVDGARIQLSTLGRGEIFGEMGAIDGEERMASAVALKVSKVIKISSDVLDAKLANTDPFIRSLIHIFIGNLRSSHEIYVKKPKGFDSYIAMMWSYLDQLQEYAALSGNNKIHEEAKPKLQKLADALTILAEFGESYKDEFNLVRDRLDETKPKSRGFRS